MGHVQQFVTLARELATEVETLQEELSTSRFVDLNNEGIDFYREVERYEIELITSALEQCDGNQAQAARLLHMKSTTLNSKMKHLGLAHVTTK